MVVSKCLIDTISKSILVTHIDTIFCPEVCYRRTLRIVQGNARPPRSGRTAPGERAAPLVASCGFFFSSKAQENPSFNDAQPEKARPEHNTSQPPENSRPYANANGKGGASDHEAPHMAEEIAHFLALHRTSKTLFRAKRKTLFDSM